MSVHIGAAKGEIAERILLPGDPLRAKWVAENYFENVKQYNSVRNMFGYTGIYKGERVSVQGTGMGLPRMPGSTRFHNILIQFFWREVRKSLIPNP